MAMKEKVMLLRLRYEGGVAAGIRKFEKMKPHVEKILSGAIQFSELSEGKSGTLSLKISRTCNKKGVLGILEEFGFHQI